MSEAKYPGIHAVINGNAAVAHVMQHVCGGVIGYPITPSTEIAELFEAARAAGGVNVFGKHPFFFEPEGEHSAQSGALGAALTGGQFVSNASSSQGILYAMESHFVTVGKKVGGFVLQVAARVVSKHSLNVMAGHDDVYALLPSGYTVLFGANPQEAADLAAISYRASALSLIPVANAMDGFSTSHMMSEALLPEPALLREYLGDPAGRIACPTVAQEILFGAKGRVAQLLAWVGRRARDLDPTAVAALRAHLEGNADAVEADAEAAGVDATLRWVPEKLHGAWRRQWQQAHPKGTRQLVPSFVDPHNPGLTGPVQNQPDFQAGAVDHRTHFAADVPDLVRRAMAEYGELTGRHYAPLMTYACDDADVVMVALGSVTDDVRAVLPVLRAQGIRAGLVSVKCLQPFPEAELVAALAGKKAVIVLERSDQMALTQFVTAAVYKGLDNARGERHLGVPALAEAPDLSSAIFGLGGHDLQPRHLVAAFKALDAGSVPPLVYLGSQFFDPDPDPELKQLQDRLRAAYPLTESMALEVEANPRLLPDEALRIRFHSVGGYGTIATGKLLTDILAGVLDMYSKSAPKYGSEKSGAATNYYITLSPEPVLLTNAELEDVEVVISPDHKVFSHANPLKGLADGGTFILQSSHDPEQVWRELPTAARRYIRSHHIKFLVIDAFEVARTHAPDPALQTRMMGIAFIGAVAAHVDRVAHGASRDEIMVKVRQQIAKKFGAKGDAIVDANMSVVVDGAAAAVPVDYDSAQLAAISDLVAPLPLRTVALSAQMADCGSQCASASGLFDYSYYDLMTGRHFRQGTIAEAPVLPGAGLFVPPGTAAGKDKGLFRRQVPVFQPELCTGCMECALVCPDAAIPNAAFELDELLGTGIRGTRLDAAGRAALTEAVPALAAAVRASYLGAKKDDRQFADIVAAAGTSVVAPDAAGALTQLVAHLRSYPVSRTRAFFDALEKQQPGTGGLFAATIDPWKCTGCLECVEVCGPHALVATEQDTQVRTMLEERFAFLAETPNTPERFHAAALGEGGDLKRMLLDRENYYASTGGHGGCRGCGEVTAIRLVISSSHALGAKRRQRQLDEASGLLERLVAKRATLAGGPDAARLARLDQAVAGLERHVYLLEGGPTGDGPASTVIANSTGCSSVYASTMPYNPYNDPWVNSLFQDAQPLAKGLFEGVASQTLDAVRALRTARLELSDAYRPGRDDQALAMLSWQQFTPDELELLPTFLTIGGDGATYDIGFGALSRVLTSGTPIKVMVLNTGVYSNTGGQASTASFIGQDSDLARAGKAHVGKTEARKELGLLSSFHPHVLVVQTATAMQAHFLKNTVEFLTYADGAALLDVYTPCQGEQGIADEQAANRGRLAVRSRMSPLFVHDPRRGETPFARFSIDGNPDPGALWVTNRLSHVAEDGSMKQLSVPLTPADFALGEARFAKQFRPLRPEEDAAAVPVDAFIDLGADDREGRVPFIWSTDADLRLTRVVCSPTIVDLVEDRRRNWQLLQYLSGQQDAELRAEHAAALAALQAKFDQAAQQREESLDEIARALSELAASGPGAALPAVGLAGERGTSVPQPRAVSAPRQALAAASGADHSAHVVELLESDRTLCTDCKTCYQEMPELFETTEVVEQGQVRQVARMIPGALDKLALTPENLARIRKVIDNCDSEIIR